MTPKVKGKKVKHLQKGDVIARWWRREFVTVQKLVEIQGRYHVICKGPTGLQMTLKHLTGDSTEDVVTIS
jgi:hypothetical protein